jgi:hypothetical protein
MMKFFTGRAARRAGRACGMLVVMGSGVVLSACSPTRLTDTDPPSNVLAPGAIATEVGAVGLYSGALTDFGAAFAGGSLLTTQPYTAINGVFSDEYTTPLSGTPQSYYDLRTMTARDMQATGAYDGLQKARVNIDEAINALVPYASSTPSSYVAELHAVKGYVYVLLSELFCSGVPFSYMGRDGKIVFGTSESTTNMLQDAIVQFDSALAIQTDSTRIQYLADVGKGRAYLDLGDFPNAKAAVANVPTNFAYQQTYTVSTFPNYLSQETMSGFAFVTIMLSDATHWPDGSEGGVGLNFSTANDPRLTTVQAGFCFIPNSGSCYLEPGKFPNAGTPVTLANGVEARLIEAEAALQAGDIPTWTSTLNTLRQSAGSTPLAALTADSTTTASDTLRENVMFRERAFWMFGTGHRTGDLRRLIRQYHRLSTTVFPSGLQPYLSSPPNVYGSEVNLEPPKNEADNNPQYHGCLNRDA